MSAPRLSLRERLSRRAGNGAGAGLLPGQGRRGNSLVESFNYAVEGIIHVLRTHRNMRLHFAAAVLVLVLALVLGVERIELVVLLLSIAFVLVAEMVNSAIEAAIDVATSSFDPLAKLAKDIAAGAVLIASINAIAVGYLVFSGQVNEPASDILDRLRDAPGEADDHRADPRHLHRDRDEGAARGAERRSGAGSPRVTRPSHSRGGWPSPRCSGPREHRFLVSTIMFGVAVLVAHTRIEAGVHSTLEVVYGGLLGAIVTLAVFQIFF